MLTDRQKFILRWLETNPQSRSRWLRNGRAAFGKPEEWDALEISGTDGSIRIHVSDWKALYPYKRICAAEENKMFAANEAGKAALAGEE
jgi:hypothetical protein